MAARGILYAPVECRINVYGIHRKLVVVVLLSIRRFKIIALSLSLSLLLSASSPISLLSLPLYLSLPSACLFLFSLSPTN